MRSGDITEVIVDYNREHVTTDDVLNNKSLTTEQKQNEINKMKYA